MNRNELPAERRRLFNGWNTLLIAALMLFHVVCYPRYWGLPEPADPLSLIIWVVILISLASGLFQILTANCAVTSVHIPPDPCQAGQAVNATVVFHGQRFLPSSTRVRIRLLQIKSNCTWCLQQPGYLIRRPLKLSDDDTNTFYEETLASFKGVPRGPVTISFSIPRSGNPLGYARLATAPGGK